MNKFLTKTLLIILSLTTVAASTIAIFLYFFPVVKQVEKEKIVYQPISLSESIQQIEKEKLDAVTKSPKPIGNLEVSGWVPDWDIPGGLVSIKKRPEVFASVSPVWFFANNDGSLKNSKNANDSDFIKYCAQNNIELIPSVAIYDSNVINDILNNEENLDRHITEIVNQAVNNNYQGIDLDYESVKLYNKDKFLDFLQQLSNKLRENGKKFSVTVPSKWGDTFYYFGYPETRQVFEYRKIAPLVDEFRIMSYEYVSPGSNRAGPIAPIAWMEKVVKYTIAEGVPRDKIMLGVHNYAYDWNTDQVMSNEDVENMDVKSGLFYNGTERAEAFFYGSIPGLLSDYDMQVTFNDTWGEAIGKYTFGGKTRTVVFMDEQGIEMRKQLAADYGLKGVVFWRLGGEGELKY